MKKTLVIYFLVLSFLTTLSQEIPIGTWRGHFASRLATCGAVAGDYIYVGCEMGMYSYNIKTGEYKTFIKSGSDGISSYEVDQIAYDQASGNLIIAYDDGNIDFFKDGIFSNLPDFFNYDFSGSKTTNHININNGIAYLSTDAGLLLVDINKKEVKETYAYIGANASLVSVNSSLIRNDSLFIATNSGVMVGSLSPTVNLKNFNRWYTYPSGQSNVAAKSVVEFGNNIYAIINSKTLTRQGKEFVIKPEMAYVETDLERLQVIGDSMFFEFTNKCRIVDKQLNIKREIVSNWIKVILVVANQYYLVTGRNGLLSNGLSVNKSFMPSSPNSNYTARVKFYDKKVFVAPGSMTPTSIDFGAPEGLNRGFYMFDNYKWTTILPAEEGRPNFNVVYDLHLKEDTLFGASYNGFMKFDYKTMKGRLYADSNSNLNSIGAGVDLYMVSGIDENSKGEVFVSQALRKSGDYSFFKASPMVASNSFQVYYQDKDNGRLTRRIMIDNNDYQWLLPFQFLWDGNNFYGNGITVYNEKASGTKYRVLTADDGRGKLTNKQVNCLTKTKNDEVWLGTDNGVCIIDDPTKIFTSSYIPDARLPVYDSRALLRNKIVNVITVDAANRKWISTSGDGAWLFSANGDSLIHQFNTKNSPLPSDQIYDIGVNPENGEVFFATDKGMVSFRSDASEPNLSVDDKIYTVKAFPNPVYSDFDGTVGISGLGPNAIVKITDITGKLVYETRANGGMATWNARDQNGSKVKTGIYIVFSATADGEVGIVTKIAVIN